MMALSHPHGVNPAGGAYFWLAAVGWRVHEPTSSFRPGVIAANKAPTVAGVKETIGNVPLTGLLLVGPEH